MFAATLALGQYAAVWSGMANRRTLSAEDWIRAAFQALGSGGVQAIRAERLARTLGVSKGSFYWHFADVPALQTAMLAHWEAFATEQIILDTDAGGGDGRARLALLVEIVTSDLSDPYGGLATEAAIRDWARHDAQVRPSLDRVDTRRLAYVGGLFGLAGLESATAARAARLYYTALIGAEHLNASPRLDIRADLQHLLLVLLGP
jgi:AcrR family transcriptional regulator